MGTSGRSAAEISLHGVVTKHRLLGGHIEKLLKYCAASGWQCPVCSWPSVPGEMTRLVLS
eukprot:scaffold2566_cov251-Ochromonas_danica.AAC.9